MPPRPYRPHTGVNIAPAAIAHCADHDEPHWHITDLQHVAGRYRCQLCDERGFVVRRDRWGDMQQLCAHHYTAMREVERCAQ